MNQQPKLKASTAKHNIGIICMQEHRYHYSEQELRYHDISNGWTCVLPFTFKNFVDATIGGVGILHSPHAIKSPNSIERIQPIMMCATFNGNPCT